MSTCKVTVETQYFNENGRPKGGRKFVFDVNADAFLYAHNAQKIIESMIADWQSNGNTCGRYEYLSHDVDFFGEIVLNGADFENKVAEIFNAEKEAQAVLSAVNPEKSHDEICEMIYNANRGK